MAKKLWGGRFAKKTHPLVEDFTSSIGYDQTLAHYDVIGSMLHVAILQRSGYLSSSEASALRRALQRIDTRIVSGSFQFDDQCEDIHTNIQQVLVKKAGAVALKIHTARSRNDQVAFATKLYVFEALSDVCGDIGTLIGSIRSTAVRYKDVVMPGFTHLQHAQPVYVKDHLAAYIKMFQRDIKRLQTTADTIEFTMGSGAMAGTPIPAASYTVKANSSFAKGVLKAVKVSATENSLDSVSDRDFVIEVLSALSILAMHLSRLSEELIIWSTKEFDFVHIDDAFCTGSSLMPQKKNPDVLELIRGYAGRVYGNLVSVLTMMKGLPLTYNRDMQLDKEPLFEALDLVSRELIVMAGLVKGLSFNMKKIREELKDEALYATDIVYYLVDKDIPFSEAHDIVGKLVRYSIDNSIEIKHMSENVLKRFSDKLVKREIIKLFDPEVSVRSKKSVRRRGV